MQVTPAAAAPAMLPIELLFDIFLYIHSSESVGAAQSCRLWYTASAEVRRVRQLSFTRASSVEPSDLQLRTARCYGTLEEVYFTGLSDESVMGLVEGLKSYAQSLKAIRCSASEEDGQDSFEPMLEVIGLAKLCPRLETLKLRSDNFFEPSDLVNSAPGIAWPRHISLTACALDDSLDGPPTVRFGMSLIDRTRSFEFKLIDYEADVLSGEEVGMSTHTFLRFFNNRTLEKLTVHGLWSGKGDPGAGSEEHSIEAPSLTHLDLRWSGDLGSNSITLSAPRLKELAIDAHLLPMLSPASTSTLSSLTLRPAKLKGPSPSYQGLSGIDGVSEYDGTLRLNGCRDHQGTVKLTAESEYMEDLLRFLSEHFIWPGLESIECELTLSSILPLVGVMIARQAGARGASKEEYIAALRDAFDALREHQVSNNSDGVIPEGTKALSAVISQGQAAVRSCSQVHWSIQVPDCLPEGIVAWLQAQPNVDVQRLSSA